MRIPGQAKVGFVSQGAAVLNGQSDTTEQFSISRSIAALVQEGIASKEVVAGGKRWVYPAEGHSPAEILDRVQAEHNALIHGLRPK